MIPDIIHFIWLPSFSTAPDYVKDNVSKWKELNPSYEIKLWEERDIFEIMTPKELFFYHSLDMYIKKADLARMIVLAKFGGFYFDCDICPSKSIKELKKGFIFSPNSDSTLEGRFVDWRFDNYDLIVSKEWGKTSEIRLANGVIICTPENEKIKKFIESRMSLVANKVLSYMGPHAFTNHIKSLKNKSGLSVLKPQILLWEDQIGEMPPWAFSKHMGVNTWGDKKRRDWWNV